MADRETVSVSLPPTMRTWIDELVGRGSYASISEYVRELVRHDQQRRWKDVVESRLVEALESGPAKPMNWNDLRRDARARLTKQKKGRGR